MKRLWIILFTGVAIGFSQNYLTPALQALPEAPAGWTRVTETALNPIPHEWPETSHAQKAWRATYSGKSQVTLTLYTMPWSPGSAWDAIQR